MRNTKKKEVMNQYHNSKETTKMHKKGFLDVKNISSKASAS